MKHTPGPWKAVIASYSEDNLSWLACADVVTPRGATLVRFEGTQDYQKNDEYEANARLIAAAPELAEEVQTLLDVIERGTETPEDLEGIIENAKRVLAKARGEK